MLFYLSHSLPQVFQFPGDRDVVSYGYQLHALYFPFLRVGHQHQGWSRFRFPSPSSIPSSPLHRSFLPSLTDMTPFVSRRGIFILPILNAFLKCGVSEKIIYSGTCTQLGAPRGPFPALISFQIPKS